MSKQMSNTLRPSILAASVLAALSLMGHQASAQPTSQDQSNMDAPKIQRVLITGSSIKRLDDEAALPVEVISREAIDKMGVTTAAELVRNISANTAPLTDGPSISDSTSGQRGLNGANMRGLGVSSTLVLLNGRRLANFASPGDNAGVDLNNIPAGAIQRVEVLKDGASAIYGTDAIGGVINFITRKDYTGIDLAASVAGTQHGGAGKRTASLSAGAGDLATDRFNVFGVLDVQQLDRLGSRQRSFIAERALATTLPAQMSSNTFPANVDISAAQRAALVSAGLLPAGSRSSRVNPSAPACNPPATVYAAQGPGGVAGCSYDYMEDTEIYPDSRKIGFIGRATYQLDDNNQLFAELVQTDAKSTYVLSPNPVRIRNLPVSILPAAYRNALSGPDLPATFSGIRYRMQEAGNRSNEVSSTGQRLVLGASGLLAGWDYDLALARAENRAVDKYVNGYVLYDQFEAGVRNGTINPFAPSSQAGLDLINSIKISDEARKAKGISTSIDGKMSRALATLGGGDLALAVGGEFRREHQVFTPSSLLVSNNIAGDRDSTVPAGELLEVETADNTRRVASVFTELNAPFTKELEMQFALRYDRYSEVGSTTNPKLGLRWQPNAALLLRASAGTGFRAPSLSDLKRPTIFGTSAGILTDPQCVAQEGSIDLCTDQWNVERRSNPDLKPEKSRQFTLGTVVELNKRTSFSVDYWNIEKRDVISTLGEQVIIENPAAYNGKYIERDEDGFISNILLMKENQGRLKTSGIDVGADWRSERGDWGRFGVNLSGTRILRYDRQFGPAEPYRSNLGVFLNDQAIQKWRHRINFEWDKGPVSLTLANQYSSSYTDQNTTYDPFTDALLAPNKVKSYSLWDLTGSWTISKQLKLRAGLLNLLDKDPPFSNQAYFFLAGYDPSYTDPRGRSGFVSVNYSFR
ncbi:TonB-dependent receptor [Massilia litorea]|uniref:TonB-dependent receptor n=1 Tax=Massilia litorea TaxID=2769491 RepID=A0A7L9U6I0_9BURK|nr:TonB-dependent receptor [Massilia litorea]QOL50651.1 TonB-dependent receptor [Massilia litorea]